MVGVFDVLAGAELAFCSCQVVLHDDGFAAVEVGGFVSVMLGFLWWHNGPDVRGLGEGDAGCTP